MADQTREELLKLLRESEQRVQEEKEQAKREREQAKRERERADQERERADQEREQAAAAKEQAATAKEQAAEAKEQAAEAKEQAAAEKEKTRHTTIDEYMATCHDSVFSKFTIGTLPGKPSSFSITNPRDKWCPTNLQPWSDFILEQRYTFGLLYDKFPAESRLFESRHFLAGLGDRVSQRPIADEKTLEYFLHNSVEDPVRVIIKKLSEVEEVTAAFDIGDGITFENHPHAISDTAEEVIERESPSPPRTPNHRLDLNKLRPDQICVTRAHSSPSAPRTMVHISEYKSPCKLTVGHLRAGLRPMNIYKEVVNRKTIPTSVDPEGHFKYRAERLTASAITQTYHYMIEGGLSYANLTIGEAIVFLKIDWEEPGTLYYHLAEPKHEVLAQSSNSHTCTAVGQYLAFTLIALGQPGEQREHGQEERQRAMNNLKTWAEDFETTFRSVSENELSVPSTVQSPPTTYAGVDRSPIQLRGKARQISVQHRVEAWMRRNDTQDPSDDELAQLPATPTPAGPSTGQGNRRSRGVQQKPRNNNQGQSRQYCTTKCLLGLVRGDFLDPKCPNVTLHSKDRLTDARHPINHSKWLELLWDQLKRTLDDGITPLDQSGARGVLFKVTLLAYGYTFLAKGTVRAFISDLEHEAAVYCRLKRVQGRHVPVFLGAIDLRSMNKVYYYFHRVYVVHMTFLSWGGDCLTDVMETSDARKILESMAITSLRGIHQEGVVHRDVRFANMLFNEEVNRVMIIDFERASLVEPPRLPLARLVPNKRPRSSEESEGKNAVTLSHGGRRARKRFSEDIANVRCSFLDWDVLSRRIVR